MCSRPAVKGTDDLKQKAVPRHAEIVKCLVGRECSRSPLLGFGQRGCEIFERGEVLLNILFGVLHRDRPLLVLPVRLRHHTAVHHAKPVVAPEILVDCDPIAVISDFFRKEH